MSRYGNRVRESSSSTGTANFTLGGATSALYQTFASQWAVTTGRFIYEILDEANEAWEIGVGYLNDATTLVRESVIDNHLGTTAKIDFAAGSKVVFSTLPASTVPDLGAANVFTENLTAKNVIAVEQLQSQIATGTAPIVVASTTKVANLNADLLDGLDSVAFSLSGHSHDHGSLSGLSDDDHPQYLMADGSRGLTSDWDVGSHQIRAETFRSDVATGTAPFVVASETVVTNLNADKLDGLDASAFALSSHNHSAADITSGTLAHERGGIEANISAVLKGDILAGTATGVMGLIAAAGKSDGDVLTIQSDGSVDWETPPTALDHGGLTGLTDDDHTQYLLVDGSRGLSGDWNAGAHEISVGSLDCGSLVADPGAVTASSYTTVTVAVADKDVASSSSNPLKGILVDATKMDIASGATDSGGHIAIDIDANVDDANFEGTLTHLMGMRITTGIASGSGTLNNTTALYIVAGSDADNVYGVYQIGTAINYFQGVVGIGAPAPTHALEVAGQILADSGSAAAPSILVGSSTTGLFSDASNRVQVSILGTEVMRLTTTGLGVNTTAVFALDVNAQTDQYFASFTVDRSTSNAWDATIKMVQVHNAVGAHSGHSYWFNESDDGASRLMGIFTCELSAAAATSTNMAGDFVWYTCEAGTTSTLQKMRLTSDGNLLIGQAASAPSSMQHGMVLQVGAAPSADVANQISLYAKDVSASAELFVRDEAGTETQLSQHASDAPVDLYDAKEYRQMVSRVYDTAAGQMEYINKSRMADEHDLLKQFCLAINPALYSSVFGNATVKRVKHVETRRNFLIRHGIDPDAIDSEQPR